VKDDHEWWKERWEEANRGPLASLRSKIGGDDLTFLNHLVAQAASLELRARTYNVRWSVLARRLVELKDSTDSQEVNRAGGDCVCAICRLAYWRHPEHPVDTFVTLLCDGSVVKL
jgi:hypothetical protein